MSDACCDIKYEHVHATRKEDYWNGKVTSNKGVKREDIVIETEELDE